MTGLERLPLQRLVKLTLGVCEFTLQPCDEFGELLRESA